ncbi:MAG: ABC transporter substrate-binding protein, partial [Acidimicrobiales bacterium]
LDGTGSGNAVTLVGSGREEFGFASLVTLSLAVASEEVPVVSVAAITQRDPSSVLFRRDSGVTEPGDLEGLVWGKTPGSSTEALFEAFAAQTDIDLASINEVSVDAAAKLTSLVNGDIDMATSFGFQEIPLFAAQGVDLGAFDFAEYGVSVLGQGVIANRQLIDDRPELVQRFVDATLRGVDAMVADPEAAVDALLAQRPDAGLDRDVARAQLEGYTGFLDIERGNFGWQDPADWENTRDVLEAFLDMAAGLDLGTVYTNDFVDDRS